MQTACKKARYEFTLAVIKNWLNKQALHQIHKPWPKFIQYAFFNNIQFLNEVHQSDTTFMPHDKVGNRIYKYRGIIKDIATRIQYANSKRGVAIAERDHQEFEKHTYFWQDAEDFYLPLTDRSRAWFKGLRINDNI
ncbi:unnamed protein product [Rhizophagus irregularis]|nr:unnamed protein product [Rhizophagus irregularis]